MANADIQWKHTFVIPSLENVHAVIHAFLRTSDYGGWEVDETEPSDSFVLNYRRGNAEPPPGRLRYVFSGSNELYVGYVAKSGWNCPSRSLQRE